VESLTFPPAYQTVHHELECTNANALITGRAGSGNSTLLSHWLGLTTKTVVVLAPSAVAALNVGGVMIHRFCRMQPNTLRGAVKMLNGPQRELYRRLDAIVIDEVSMVRADTLDCLEHFMRRNGPLPGEAFGVAS
jgi:hypothetical protein